MLSGVTRNISSGGVLITTQKESDVGVSIEYIITLAGPSDHTVNLRCIGKVVRSTRSDRGDAAYDIAATLERYEFLRPEE